MATIVLFVLFLCRKNHRDITLWCVMLDLSTVDTKNVSLIIAKLIYSSPLCLFDFYLFIYYGVLVRLHYLGGGG